jgi:MFS family permease
MTSELKRRRFYGPWIVVGAFVLSFCAFGTFIYSFPVFFQAMSVDMGWSRGATAMAIALSALLFGILSMFLGAILSRVGARAMFVWGCLIGGIGFILLSTLTTLWQFYLYYALILTFGIASMGFVPGFATVSNWYVRRRSTALGIVSVGAGAGGAVMAPVANHLISSYSWSTAFLFMAAMLIVIGTPIAAFVMRTKPEDIGQLPDGEVPEEANPSPVKKNDLAPLPGFTFRQAVRTRALWLIGIGGLLWGVGFLMGLTHSVAHAVDIGIPAAVAAGAAGFLSLFSIVGRLGFGWMGDRIDKRYVLMAIMACGLLAYIALMLAKSVFLLYIFAFFLGLCVGGITPLVPAILADYFGRRDYGTIYGFSGMFLREVGCAAGPILAGYLFDITGSYEIAFIVGTVAMAAGIVVFFFARPPRPLESLSGRLGEFQ